MFFLKIPEDRGVIWKAPNHPQSGLMSKEFMRQLEFNHVEKKNKEKPQQLKNPWKISKFVSPLHK